MSAQRLASYAVLAVFTTLLIVSVLSLSSTSVDAVTVRGRAYVMYVNLPSSGFNSQYHADTGWLPPTGGSLRADAANWSIVNVASASLMSASSGGDECGGESQVMINTGVLLPGHAAEITFSSLSGNDDDECCSDDGDSPESAVIQGLTFGGQAVNVTGAFNQKFVLPGVAVLTINEVIFEDDDDCDDDDFTVNALHLVLANGEEIIVGSTFFESDDDCCPVKNEPGTWGRIKSLFGN